MRDGVLRLVTTAKLTLPGGGVSSTTLKLGS
jgi:hypothetical protein